MQLLEVELIPAAVSTQGLLKLKIFAIEKVLSTSSNAVLTVSGRSANRIPVDEIMIVSSLASISLFIAQIFRLFWGEASPSVVFILSHKTTKECIKDLVGRVLNAEALLVKLFNTSVEELSQHFPTDSTIANVLPHWKTMMRSFCQITSQPSIAPRDTRIEEFIKHAHELHVSFCLNCCRENR